MVIFKEISSLSTPYCPDVIWYFVFIQRLYREKGENEKHTYTITGDLPEHMQAKINAMNLSEVRFLHVCYAVSVPLLLLNLISTYFMCSSCVFILKTCYKESWTKLRDAGYQLRLDAIPFQAAKSSGDILSDVRVILSCIILCFFYYYYIFFYQGKVTKLYIFSLLAKIQRAVWEVKG